MTYKLPNRDIARIKDPPAKTLFVCRTRTPTVARSILNSKAAGEPPPGTSANLGLSMGPLTGNRYALAAGNPVGFVEVEQLYWANRCRDGDGSTKPILKVKVGDFVWAGDPVTGEKVLGESRLSSKATV